MPVLDTTSVTPEQVEHWVSNGVSHDAIAKVLVASGAWTENGAKEIIASFTSPDGLVAESVEEVGRPEPLEDVPPLLAT